MRDIALHERLALPAKITVLAAGTSNGIDTQNRFSIPDVDERREARQALGIAENSCVIGFVGRIVRDKGIRELTGAWTLLKADFPGLRLLIAGPEEPQDAPEASVMTQLKSDSRVTLLGYMSDPRTAYCAMDVVTLPSYREGFPSVPLEAAAMGLPVVATSVPGCLDAVIDGYTGRLVQVGSAETLAVALREYVSNPTLRKTHGETGAARVRRLFSQERLWSALAHHYELHRQEAMQKARSGQDSNGV